MNLRSSLAILLSLVAATSYAKANPIALIGLSAGYSPGVPFVFDIALPPMAELGSYNIDLVLMGDSGVAGSDFLFDLGQTSPASSNYVFASAANFFGAVNIDAVSSMRLTLTDFDFAGTNVVAGVNDLVARVTVKTLATFQGQLTLSVDAASLILDTPNVVPTPVPEFSEIQNAVAAAGPNILPAVPEPATASLLVLFAWIVGGARRLAKSLPALKLLSVGEVYGDAMGREPLGFAGRVLD